MFQVFHLDVAKVDMGCRLCYNDNIRMLQAYVSSVLGIFRRMFQVFHLDVAYVVMALPACCKRVFQVFHTYVISVLFGCCKSRSRCCICCYDYTRMFHVHVRFIYFRRML